MKEFKIELVLSFMEPRDKIQNKLFKDLDAAADRRIHKPKKKGRMI